METKLEKAGWKTWSVSIPMSEEFARQMKESQDLRVDGLPKEENQRREVYLKTRIGRLRRWSNNQLENLGERTESALFRLAYKINPPSPNYGINGTIYRDLFPKKEGQSSVP